jgi:hypothetical protein
MRNEAGPPEATPPSREGVASRTTGWLAIVAGSFVLIYALSLVAGDIVSYGFDPRDRATSLCNQRQFPTNEGYLECIDREDNSSPIVRAAPWFLAGGAVLVFGVWLVACQRRFQINGTSWAKYDIDPGINHYRLPQE